MANEPIRPPAPPGRKWKWADGKMHDAPQPSARDLVIPAEPGWKPPAPTVEASVPVASAFAAVPHDFAFTDRARLRMQALDFAIRGGQAAGMRVRSGAELLAEAEIIERWIVGKCLSGKET